MSESESADATEVIYGERQDIDASRVDVSDDRRTSVGELVACALVVCLCEIVGERGVRQTRSGRGCGWSRWDSNINSNAGIFWWGTGGGLWADADADVGRAAPGEILKPLGGFECDICRRSAPGGKRCECAEDCVEGIADGVGERGFGCLTAGKDVVAERIQGFGAGAGGGLELVRECREPEFTLKEESEEVAGQSVVSVLAGKAVEGEAS